MFEMKEGKRVFLYGKEDYLKAVEASQICNYFTLDKDEDELVTVTDKSSCYNCLFRRWTVESFMCMKKQTHEC